MGKKKLKCAKRKAVCVKWVPRKKTRKPRTPKSRTKRTKTPKKESPFVSMGG